MLRYLLDTNICIYISKQKPPSVLNKFKHLSVGEVGISTITYGELLYGARKSQFAKKTQLQLEALAEHIPPLPLSIQAAEYYADIRHGLEKNGRLIGNNDLWIAAHAIALRVILVTNNLKEFSRISHLKLENWVE